MQVAPHLRWSLRVSAELRAPRPSWPLQLEQDGLERHDHSLYSLAVTTCRTQACHCSCSMTDEFSARLQAKLDSVAAEQPAPDNASNMTSLTWRGISYHVRNMRIRANLQQVAELSQQHQDGMQIDQAAHEAGQHDALIGALNETKASLGTVLKTAPGVVRLLKPTVLSKCWI